MVYIYIEIYQSMKFCGRIFYLFIKVLYAGELNPVGPKAQRKVPIPEGLDLDAWINEVMSIDLVCY